MIGIVSYGGYIPRLRLDRMSIYQQIGWLAPAVIMVAQGERSMCNWDEDSLTMAVAATRDCLLGTNKQEVDALYLASTTLPFADRLNAGIVATALNLVRSSAAIEETLRDEVDVLRDEVSFLREEISRLDTIIMSLTQNVKLLEAPRQAQPRMSWWHRLKSKLIGG